MDQYWPVSLMAPKLPIGIDSITVIASGLLGWVYISVLVEAKKSFIWIMGLGGLLIVTTTLFHGFTAGFIAPVVETNSYWTEGIKVNNYWAFVSHFTALQQGLVLHASSHPPGPVLYSAVINRLTHSPVLWSLGVLLIGVITSWPIYLYLRKTIPHRIAYYTAGLFLLLPAIHIYFLASIDAVILFLMFLTYYFWSTQKPSRIWSTALSLFITSWFTYAFLFLIPVFLFDEWRTKKSVRASSLIISMVVGLWVLTYFLSGFHYWASMQQATQVYAVGGLHLLINPLSYLITRVENFLEILVFLTPWLGWIIWQEFRFWRPWQPRVWRRHEMVSFIAIAALLGFFLCGAYATGETARNAGYIYPFLMTGVAYFLNRVKASAQALRLLAWLVLGQTILMQMFGYYFW